MLQRMLHRIEYESAAFKGLPEDLDDWFKMPRALQNWVVPIMSLD